MGKKNNIENKIKETFDGRHKSAPQDLWNKVSYNLPDSDSDKNIEKKIKNVFEKSDQSAPPVVWGNVNKQLNIDKVWNNISKELDKRPVIYWRNIASVALFLLLVSTILYRYNLSITDNKIDHTLLSQTQINNDINLKIKKDVPIQKKSEFILNKKNNNTSTKNTRASKKQDLNSSNGTQANRKMEEKNIKSNGVISIETNALLKNNISLESDTLQNDHILSPLDLTLIQTSPILINNADTNIILNSNIDPSFEDLVLPSKQKRFEFGITYSYNNTWILNSETQQSFDKNSLTKTSFAFAGSYGLVAAYNFSKYNALTSELYINSRSQQQYGEFIEGKYYIHTLQFNYTKLTLLYQLNLNQSPHNKISSKYTFRAGLYGSYLKNFKHTYNYAINTHSDKYTKTDYGFKIAIGQEKTFKRIILGYGFNGEYGFHNNFAGNNKMPAAFNITKNALLGVYLNSKYSF
ncbi:MAG: hypothetical protein Q8L81_07260 [Bacteroidota bacterium]|nr:hypothetical protein [Bacteroidota bacterium]